MSDSHIPPPLSREPKVDRRLLELQAEIMVRENEALNLYEPMPKQNDFHSCEAMDRIGTGGNRGGKSLMGFVEDARAVLGRDPHKKYPSEGVLMIIGYGWEHCGKVVWPMLFQKGAFKIIKDKETGKWRGYRPYSVEDMERKSESRPAPPLIPQRYLAGGYKNAIAWVDKKMRQFSRIELTTGWTIYYFASEGDPEQAQGFQVDLIHCDENIHDQRWISESMSRGADRKARFYWTTLVGEDRTGALDQLLEDADKQSGRPNPRIVRFDMSFIDNRHIGTEEKQLTLQRWAAMGEDEVRRRAYGMPGQNYLMYPSFNVAVHGYDLTTLPKQAIPPHWTRYMIVDPGHAVCGTLFAAVPPPHEVRGRQIIVYDELYMEQCTAAEWGVQVAAKAGNQYFNAFVIDDHGGNLSDLSTGSTWKQILSSELRRQGVKSERTGFHFVPGSDDIEARANSVRMKLSTHDGPPILRFINGAVPHTVRTMQRYHKKVDRLTKRITDKPENKGDVHMAQLVEYLCAFDPQYHKPPVRKREASWAVKEFRKEQSRRNHSISLV